MTTKQNRVAILFPADAAERHSVRLEETRHSKTASALRAVGIEVEGVPYADEVVAEVRAKLLRFDGVLVWVNPVERGRDRSVLNAMLEDIAAQGVFVSAHPDVIRKIGTKEVLYRTRSMGWGCDTRQYPNASRMRTEFPASLASGPARVLKQLRGNGGNGVWKVEPVEAVQPGAGSVPLSAHVRVKHAKRGSVAEEMPLERLLSTCEAYFSGQDGIVDQVYQPRLTEGMVRCYMVQNRVAGFGEQLVNALYPPAPGAESRNAPEPGPRLYYPPTRPDFQSLKNRLEREWLAELCEMVSLDAARLPMIWDADFFYGPKNPDGIDTYVLCEINVSSVYPFPDDALVPLAKATLEQLKAKC
ncbi:MAG: Cj0069 family protein [Alphaproteobacteria bacterium]|nr:Cj0069 family protein [Alphaproteobacteria bacterium]